MDQNKLPLDIHYLGVPFGCAQSDFHARGTFGANCAPILRRDKHFLQTDRYELPLRSTIRCAQNDFHSRGTFGANLAPILR